MTKQKDRHLEAPGEANRDKHVNFLADENGDIDPADDNSGNNKNEESEDGDDNGFFTDDDNQLQTQKEYDNYKSHRFEKKEKVIPVPTSSNKTVTDKITVNAKIEDLLTPVIDDDSKPYIQEDDQAH